MSNKNLNGCGNSIPPIKKHVLIYFIQHGKAETDAIKFFDYFVLNRWRNSKGAIIKNWKWTAWDWIYQRASNRKNKRPMQ